jgi:hypothetical protein
MSRRFFESESDYQRRAAREGNEETVRQSTGNRPERDFFESQSDYDRRVGRRANEETVRRSTGSRPERAIFETEADYDRRVARRANEIRTEPGAGASAASAHSSADPRDRSRPSAGGGGANSAGSGNRSSGPLAWGWPWGVAVAIGLAWLLGATLAGRPEVKTPRQQAPASVQLLAPSGKWSEPVAVADGFCVDIRPLVGGIGMDQLEGRWGRNAGRIWVNLKANTPEPIPVELHLKPEASCRGVLNLSSTFVAPSPGEILAARRSPVASGYFFHETILKRKTDQLRWQFGSKGRNASPLFYKPRGVCIEWNTYPVLEDLHLATLDQATGRFVPATTRDAGMDGSGLFYFYSHEPPRQVGFTLRPCERLRASGRKGSLFKDDGGPILKPYPR